MLTENKYSFNLKSLNQFFIFEFTKPNMSQQEISELLDALLSVIDTKTKEMLNENE